MTHTAVFRSEGTIGHHFLLKIQPLHLNQMQQLWEEGHPNSNVHDPRADALCFMAWYETLLQSMVQQGSDQLLYRGIEGTFQEIEWYEGVKFQKTDSLPNTLSTHTSKSIISALPKGMYIQWSEYFQGELSCTLELPNQEIQWQELHVQQEQLAGSVAGKDTQHEFLKGIQYGDTFYSTSMQMEQCELEDMRFDVRVFRLSSDNDSKPEVVFGQ